MSWVCDSPMAVLATEPCAIERDQDTAELLGSPREQQRKGRGRR